MNFIDLAAQQKRIRENIDANISKVLDHGMYINGPEVRELEERLAKFSGVSYAVGCSSGTDALLMSLMAYGVSYGDAVFTTTFTFISTAEVVQLLHATPVFVDIEPDTFNIDVAKLEEAIEKTIKEGRLKPKGIIPVDIFGQTADYDEINALAKKYDLFVMEDAAQSFGATYKGKRACSLADVGVTSFYPAKPLGCYGDGGMIFTDDKDLYDDLLSIRDHGHGSEKYSNVRIGINGRIDSIQTAILLAKLEIFEDEIRFRQDISERYTNRLNGNIKTPFIKDHNTSAWALYSIISDEREALMGKLKENGIPCVIYYPISLHLQEAFSHLGYKPGDFPISEDVSKKILSLPMHPYLAEDDQEKIIQIIKTCK